MTQNVQSFDAIVIVGPRRRIYVPLPFTPDDVWGTKSDHHVAGSVNGMPVRAVVEQLDSGYGIVLGPAWRRDCGVGPGDNVAVLLDAEGPQRDDLPDDFRNALESQPAAAAYTTVTEPASHQLALSAVVDADPAGGATGADARPPPRRPQRRAAHPRAA